MSHEGVNLELTLEHGQSSFEPGGRLAGVASWFAASAPSRLELQLSWTAQGWGGRDLKIVETLTFSEPRPAERRPFILRLPPLPYSFRGTLMSISWALELVSWPGDEKVRVELTVAPGRREIHLAAPARTTPR
jgi:hypothetical protein